MALVRHGDLAHPAGGVRHGDLAHSSLAGDETAPVLTNAAPSNFAVGSVDISVTGDEAGTTYLVVTDGADKPSKAQVKAGQDHEGEEAEVSASAAAGVGEQTFSGVSVSAGLWYAHLMREDASGNQGEVVSTVQFRVPSDTDGPAEWMIIAAAGPYPEKSIADAISASFTVAEGDYLFIDVDDGAISQLQANTALLAGELPLNLSVQAWDVSANDGLGGLSEVYAVSYAALVAGSASLEATAELTVSGQKEASGSADADAAAAVESQGQKHAFGAASMAAVAEVSATGTSGQAESGEASIDAVASLEAAGTKHAFGTASMSAVAQVAAQGSAVESGGADLGAVASLEVFGRKHAFGVASMAAVAGVSVSGGEDLPDEVTWVISVTVDRKSHLGVRTAGDDMRLVVPVGVSLAGLTSAKFVIQRRGVAQVQKALDDGIEVTDADGGELTVEIAGADTEGLAGVMDWEIEVVDFDGNHRTPAWGVIAFRQALIANAS